MNSIAYFLDKNTFEIKEVVQIKNYQINIDEETNAKTSISILKNISVKDKDIIFIKENEKTQYMGIIEAPNASNDAIYEIKAKYITNLFDRKIVLKNENIISEQGIEDFIAYTIKNEFLNSDDTLLNLNYIDIEVLTHTKKNFSVSTQNGIYNFHTFMNNCTQNYGISYVFSVINGRLKIAIKNIENEEAILIDANTSNIMNYNEVLSTNVTAKVTVFCEENNQEYDYFLLNDRTTTTDRDDTNRAVGEIEVIYERQEADVKQAALNVFKSNSYSHLIQFDISKDTRLYDVQNWQIGALVKIKNKDGDIIDTYISAITINKDNPIYSIKTGNIRVNFLDKIKQEKYKEG